MCKHLCPSSPIILKKRPLIKGQYILTWFSPNPFLLRRTFLLQLSAFSLCCLFLPCKWVVILRFHTLSSIHQFKIHFLNHIPFLHLYPTFYERGFVFISTSSNSVTSSLHLALSPNPFLIFHWWNQQKHLVANINKLPQT